ncbi:MAG: hypothetical protein ABF651_00130 [Sporolactobacillus sp.]
MLTFKFFLIKVKIDTKWTDLTGIIEDEDFIDEGNNGDVYFYVDSETKEEILNYRGYPIQLSKPTFDDDENQLDTFVIHQFDKWSYEENKIICLSRRTYYHKAN